MSGYTTSALDRSTWAAFAALVEANDGVWGGCWCTGFHPEGAVKVPSAEVRRQQKQQRVCEGTTHSALVLDGSGACVGWCQFGSPAELPNIKSRRAYLGGLVDLPDWRITCFFVGKGHRGRGVAAAGLAGALRQIADLGGGVVEAYPEDTADRKVSGSFLHGGTLAMFEAAGFSRDRLIGKHRWVVRRTVR